MKKREFLEDIFSTISGNFFIQKYSLLPTKNPFLYSFQITIYINLNIRHYQSQLKTLVFRLEVIATAGSRAGVVLDDNQLFQITKLIEYINGTSYPVYPLLFNYLSEHRRSRE